jgi:hypothetical protein
MNNLASLFIDDELNLAEKRVFVETVHKDGAFYGETLDLIDQEMILSGDVVEHLPVIAFPDAFKEKNNRLLALLRHMFRPMGLGLALTAAAAFVIYFSHVQWNPPQAQMNRFVIYKPDASKVEITGSFTGWEKVPMHEAGDSGYWEVTLELPRGVHRFTYILDGSISFADPTVLASEQDDFGGVDSIISTEI